MHLQFVSYKQGLQFVSNKQGLQSVNYKQGLLAYVYTNQTHWKHGSTYPRNYAATPSTTFAIAFVGGHCFEAGRWSMAAAASAWLRCKWAAAVPWRAAELRVPSEPFSWFVLLVLGFGANERLLCLDALLSYEFQVSHYDLCCLCLALMRMSGCCALTRCWTTGYKRVWSLGYVSFVQTLAANGRFDTSERRMMYVDL